MARKKHNRHPKDIRLTSNEKRLVKRYLIWCYKTTKEELDRIDRKFTQLKVDTLILDGHHQGVADLPAELRQDYSKLINDFKTYIQKKQEEAANSRLLESGGKPLAAQHAFLVNRFAAIQRAISYFLGVRELKSIEALYEEEMTERILTSREHTH